ncbi:MAG: type VI secretion system contractile sheath large subunit [Gammaproteobacteria bacterium]
MAQRPKPSEAEGRDRVRLVYRSAIDPDAGDIELPLRLLVLAHLGGPRAQAGDVTGRRAIQLTRENYDTVLASAGVRVTLRVADHLRGDPGETMDIELCFRALADFGPDVIVGAVPDLRLMADLQSVLESARDGNGTLDGLSPAQHALAARMGFDDLKGMEPDFLNLAISEIVERLSRQMDAILQDSHYQRLESTWRSLRTLVERPVRNASVHVLDIAKTELADDFDDSPEVAQSFLYQVAYTSEYGQYGGKPYGAIIGDYRFSADEADLRLLRNIAAVASMSHTPFLSSVSPVMFGLGDFGALPGFGGLADLLDQGVQFARWRSFRERPDARYVGLVLPGFRLRAPWDYRRHGITRFPYRERVGRDLNRNLWGNPAFAFAGCLLASFERSGWCLDIIGADAGRVAVPGLDDDHLPAEILLSERRESELADAGFIPLTVHKGDRQIAFYSANSTYRAPISRNGGSAFREDPNEKIDGRIAAQLPYLFVISRLAHYLKVIQRDNIGVSKTRAEMESELNGWLVQYVSDMDNPSPPVRARRPLRRASIHIGASDGEAGWYRMQLNLTPHFRYLGAAFQLDLEGRLDPPRP